MKESPAGAPEGPWSDVLARLAAGGPGRLWTLEDLAHEPTGDPAVARAIERCLDLRSPCRLNQFYVGETRLLAGIALAAERAVNRPAEPIRLRSLPPVRTGDLITRFESAGLPWPQPADENADAALIAFGIAQQHGLFVEQDFDLVHPVDLSALAAELPPDLSLSNLLPVEPDQTSGATAPVRTPTAEDVAFYIQLLAHGTVDDRVFTLQELTRQPTGDPRVREALEPLLNDESPCVLQIPYRFGEIRYLACHALAAERSAAGDHRPVRLRCTAPLTANQLAMARSVAQVPAIHSANPIESQLALFALLRERGLLPQVDLEILPFRADDARPLESDPPK